jgi:hypothetical protein
MTTMDRLKIMLTGKKNKMGKPDPEDVAELKAGKIDSPKEEMLEDAKGRPMRLRVKGMKR